MKKVKLGPETLLYPTPAVLVGAIVEGKPNFMTAAWCGIASSQPPALSVAIRPQRYTYIGIVENNSFSINVPSATWFKMSIFAAFIPGRKKTNRNYSNAFTGLLKPLL